MGLHHVPQSKGRIEIFAKLFYTHSLNGFRRSNAMPTSRHVHSASKGDRPACIRMLGREPRQAGGSGSHPEERRLSTYLCNRSIPNTSQRLNEVEGAISKLLSDSTSHLSGLTVQANINYPKILIDLMSLNLLPISRKWDLNLDDKSYFHSSNYSTSSLIILTDRM